jgi:trehalose-phosphatase
VTSSHSPEWDHPAVLAKAIGALERPVAVVFDCDGVLAPLVDHADDSALLDGVGALLTQLAQTDDLSVAILSGRSLDGLAQFAFHESIIVAGSYGSERRGSADSALSEAELALLNRLDTIATEAAAAAGPGAWVERKPTSVVTHVRNAEPKRAAAALATAWEQQAELSGHAAHDGNQVIELMARPADKGTGLDRLRHDIGAATVVYIGDDVPDEDAFARLGSADIGIKIGEGHTRAARRLSSPQAVRDLLTALTAAQSATSSVAQKSVD